MGNIQYNKIKKYKKNRVGVITTRNIVLLTVIIATFVSVGYSYWNTTLHISGTVAAVSQNTAVGNVYDPDNLVEGTHTFKDSPGQPIVTVTNGVVTEYTFTDTSGVDINANPIDTGFLPYTNNKNYELSFTATFPSATNKPQSAVLIDVSTLDDSSAFRIAYANNGNSPRLFVNNTGKGLNLSNNTITFTLTYQNGSYTIRCNGGKVNAPNGGQLSLSGIRLLLGYTLDSNGNITRQAVATITQFSVKEI